MNFLERVRRAQGAVGPITEAHVDHDPGYPRAPRHRPTPETPCNCTPDIFITTDDGAGYEVMPDGVCRRRVELMAVDDKMIEVLATGDHVPTIATDPRLCAACGRRLRSDDDVGGSVIYWPWASGSSIEQPNAVHREHIEYPVCVRCARKPKKAQRRVRERIERAAAAELS